MALVVVKGSTWLSEANLLIDTVSDLSLIIELEKNVIITKGHTTSDDGGGGSFIYNELTARSTADGGIIIDPSNTGSGNGCWHREFTLGNYSLRFFGSDDSDTANLLSEYGIDGATVNISSTNGGTFIYDSNEVSNSDGIDTFNGWVRVNDHYIRNDLEALTGVIKLGDGVYEDGKEYLIPEQYLIDPSDGKAYIPGLNLNLPYSVNIISYPTASSDPNLVFYSSNAATSGGKFQEESVTLIDGQLSVSFGLPVEIAQFYITGFGKLDSSQFTRNVGLNQIDLIESYPAGLKITLTTL